jgi:hypothetical protein
MLFLSGEPARGLFAVVSGKIRAFQQNEDGREQVIILNRFAGKRALSTGGKTWIGLETARQFLDDGVRVAITGTNPQTWKQRYLDLTANSNSRI